MADELINMFNKIVAAIESDKPKRVAASTVLAIQRERIFAQGKSSDGSQIGTYSTKPISISESRQARNTGQTRFEGGYAEYKSKIGKNPGYVNLRNTDQMYADYGYVVSDRDLSLGFQNDDNAQKRAWMEDKYSKEIFHQSDAEIDMFIDVLVNEQSKMI